LTSVSDIFTSEQPTHHEEPTYHEEDLAFNDNDSEDMQEDILNEIYNKTVEVSLPELSWLNFLEFRRYFIVHITLLIVYIWHLKCMIPEATTLWEIEGCQERLK